MDGLPEESSSGESGRRVLAEASAPEIPPWRGFEGEPEIRENPGTRGLSGLRRKVAANTNAIHALQRGQKKLAATVRKQGSALVKVLRKIGGQKNHLRRLSSGR